MNRTRHRRLRGGFTLIEVLVVAGLMALLAMLLQSSWGGFGRPMVEAISRARITQNANLAAASLARDFCGSLANAEGRVGGVSSGKLVGRAQPDGNVLRLCFDGGTVPDGVADWGGLDSVITYHVVDGNLVRWDETAGTTFVVARNVDELQLEDQGIGVQIRLTFSHRSITRTYTLVGLDP